MIGTALLPERDAEAALVPLLGAFTVASDALLRERLLLHRVDRKYLVASSQLATLLAPLTRSHHLLQAAGRGMATYRTEYFDTPDRQSYEDHRRGRRPRTKVRIRHHVERAVSFLEVKRKQADGRTEKWREPHAFGDDALDDAARRFVAAHGALSAPILMRAAGVDFRRITLLSVTTAERITIDHAIAVRCGSARQTLDNLAIVEVKQARRTAASEVIPVLRAVRARELAVSKYCIAVARLAPVRSNTFKPGLRAIERIHS